jgi:predicted transcriptional regulator
MSVTTVRLRQDVEMNLGALADKLQRSKGWLINQALEEFFARQELEFLRWQETLAAMESVTEGRVVSGETVHAWLATWGSKEELPPPKTGD